MHSTIPHRSQRPRTSEHPRSVRASCAPGDGPSCLPPPRPTFIPREASLTPPDPVPEVVRLDLARTRHRDAAALRALASRVLSRADRAEKLGGEVVPLFAANDTGPGGAPEHAAILGHGTAPPASPWSLVVTRVSEAVSEPPPSWGPGRGCA